MERVGFVQGGNPYEEERPSPWRHLEEQAFVQRKCIHIEERAFWPASARYEQKGFGPSGSGSDAPRFNVVCT